MSLDAPLLQEEDQIDILVDNGGNGATTKGLQVTHEGQSLWIWNVLSYPFKLLGRGIHAAWFTLTHDKKRLIHSAKVGLALTVTSLCILITMDKHPTLVGHNGIWAIMTVIVVFEPTAGATFLKGLNRSLGTILAGALVLLGSLLCQFVEMELGTTAITSAELFCVGFGCTFLRSLPKLKSKFDYAIVVFLLSFSLFTISNVHPLQQLQTALSRLLMILLGCVVTLTMSACVFPARAGDELHSLIGSHFERLATCIEGSVREYIHKPRQLIYREDDDAIYKDYNLLIQATNTEVSLSEYATLEVSCKNFIKFRYPWKEYVRVGTSLRRCAYASMALHSFLTAEVQAPVQIRKTFGQPLSQVSTEIAKLLYELGNNLKKMQKNRPMEELLSGVNRGAHQLQKMVDSYDFMACDRGGACSPQLSRDSGSYNAFLAFVSHIIETVARLEQVVVVLDQLGAIARFKDSDESKVMLNK